MKKELLLLTLFLLTSSSCTTTGVRNAKAEQNEADQAIALINKYFDGYCDNDGNMGLGFVAWHTYNHRYRQRLKQTDDIELKRLFVLYKFHSQIRFSISDFEEGKVSVGKGEVRPMTLTEWNERRNYLNQRIDEIDLITNYHDFATDFSGFVGQQEDPDFDQEYVAELREQVAAVKPPTD